MSTPLVPVTTLPPDVRVAGVEARALYGAALGFEQLLVRRIAESLADMSGSEGGQSAATGVVAQLLPDALAQGVADGGGIGLARELYDSLRRDER